MFQGDQKFYSLDRYIPTRAFIDFDEAYLKLIYRHFEEPRDGFSSLSCTVNKNLEFRKRLASLSKIDQRIFNIKPYTSDNKKYIPPVRIWPCRYRKKPAIVSEKMLDLPGFNSGFDFNTIDWGPNDLIATSISGRVLVGGGFFDGKAPTRHTVVEYTNDKATALHWSPDGKNLAIGTEKGIIQLWHILKKESLSEVKCCVVGSCTVTSIQWHPQGKCLAWGCGRGKLSIRSIDSNQGVDIEYAHDGNICGLKFSPKADYLCSSGRDGLVRIWRGANYEPYLQIEMSNPVRAITWHPWRSGILAVGEGPPGPSSLSIWNINTGKLLHLQNSDKPNAIKALDFNPLTGELVCSQLVFNNLPQCDGRAEILVFGGRGYVVDSITEITGIVYSLLWSPDGTKLGTASTDETLTLWTFYHSQGKKRSLCTSDQDLGLLALKKFKCTVR